MNKPKVPPSKVPIIGGDKERDMALVNTILAQIDPVLQKILEGIDGLERRVAVVEEVKQLFPAKIEVIVKHDGSVVTKEQVQKVLKELKMY